MPSYPRHFVAIVDMVLGCLRACQPIHLVLAGLLAAGVASIELMRRRRRTVYLIDYACSQGIGNCRVPKATFIEHIHLDPLFDDRSVSFMTRMLESSAIGEETRLPPGDLYMPAQNSLHEARAEAELVVFSAIDDLLAKTAVTADAIDILVVNCSVFAPAPSISDMIVNRYKLRDGVRAVNLSGMGCSAGVISVGLAAGLLQATARGVAYALVVSTEIITSNFYTGKERPMQLSNILFRVGGTAALLSTSEDRARFRLSHLVRTSTTGTRDGSYSCVFQEEDVEGNLGVNLSKDLLAFAGDALRANITAVAPLVLPLSEQGLFAVSVVARKLGLAVKLHVPDFRKAFDHFCMHCGGRAVVDKVQRSLGLSDEQVEASRMTLRRFGNTSSTTLWYELAYIEAKGRMRKHDRVWMIGFGSGFKCNSAVWECIRPANDPDRAWAGCIHRYPTN